MKKRSLILIGVCLLLAAAAIGSSSAWACYEGDEEFYDFWIKGRAVLIHGAGGKPLQIFRADTITSHEGNVIKIRNFRTTDAKTTVYSAVDGKPMEQIWEEITSYGTVEFCINPKTRNVYHNWLDSYEIRVKRVWHANNYSPIHPPDENP